MKIFWSILVGFFILLFSFIFFIWNFAPSWVSKTLSEKAKVPVSIRYLSFNLNSIGVYNLKVKNPKNAILTYALKTKKILSKTYFMNYFQQNILIDELVMDKIYLGLEFQSAFQHQGNWTTIMNNLRSSLDDKSQASKKTVLIKKLVLKNLDIDLVFRQNDGHIKHLKPIEYMEFHNVSSEGGLPTAQIMNLIMSEVLKEVFSRENLMNMLQDILQTPGRSGSDIFNSLKSLFSNIEEIKQEKTSQNF